LWIRKLISISHQLLGSTQPGHPSLSRHLEYQWKLGSKPAYNLMH